jgi:hypothetical protein
MKALLRSGINDPDPQHSATDFSYWLCFLIWISISLLLVDFVSALSDRKWTIHWCGLQNGAKAWAESWKMSLAGMAVGINFKYILAVLSSPPNEEFILTSFWIRHSCAHWLEICCQRGSKSLKMIKYWNIFFNFFKSLINRRIEAGTVYVIQNSWILILEPN